MGIDHAAPSDRFCSGRWVAIQQAQMALLAARSPGSKRDHDGTEDGQIQQELPGISGKVFEHVGKSSSKFQSFCPSTYYSYNMDPII